MGKRFTGTDASASLRDLDVTGDGLPCRGIAATDQRACDQTLSQADVFDRWPSSDALERRSFSQRRAAFLLRSVPKFVPCAASDFVVAAARAPNNVTIEILWGEVSGFASTH
jgi:hypothetical protein